MTKKEIVIDVSDTGDIQIATTGFKGKSCLEETEFLKNLLGKETFQKLTPAYYEQIKVKKYIQLCG